MFFLEVLVFFFLILLRVVLSLRGTLTIFGSLEESKKHYQFGDNLRKVCKLFPYFFINKDLLSYSSKAL
jgi:hypothetical protein